MKIKLSKEALHLTLFYSFPNFSISEFKDKNYVRYIGFLSNFVLILKYSLLLLKPFYGPWAWLLD